MQQLKETGLWRAALQWQQWSDSRYTLAAKVIELGEDLCESMGEIGIEVDSFISSKNKCKGIRKIH